MESRKEVWVLGTHSQKDLVSKRGIALRFSLQKNDFDFLSDESKGVMLDIMSIDGFKDIQNLKLYVENTIARFLSEEDTLLVFFLDAWLRDECDDVSEIFTPERLSFLPFFNKIKEDRQKPYGLDISDIEDRGPDDSPDECKKEFYPIDNKALFRDMSPN